MVALVILTAQILLLLSLHHPAASLQEPPERLHSQPFHCALQTSPTST